MALVVNDRVKETSTTTGTGTFDLAGAISGFETFVAGIGNSNTTYYAIVNSNGEFEVGLGTVTDAATDTLSRDTIISSSNSDSAVDFSAGTKNVFCTLPASKAVILDSSGNIVANNGSNLTNLNADNLASGTVPDARFPATLPAANGSALTNLNASNLATGTVDNARLDADLAAIGGLTSAADKGIQFTGSGTAGTYDLTTAGKALLDDADAAAQRTTLGLGSIAELNTVTLTTDTTGDYVASFTAGTGITGDATGEGSTPTIALDLDELTTSVSDADGDFFPVVDSLGAQKKLAKGNINISGFNNDSGFIDGSSLNADNLSSGTVPDARFPATLPAASGANLTNLNADNLASGTVPNTRLDQQLQDVAGLAVTDGNFIVGNGANFVAESGATARTSLGLGSIATLSEVALGTNTSGNYVASLVAGNLIDLQNNSGEGATPTVDVDLSELTTSTSDADGDFFAVIDSANAQKKLTKANINISGFNNDAGYTTNTGDITAVTAGNGLTGGATSGAATLNVGPGTGIDVAADTVSVDVSDFMSNGSNNRVVTATGTDAMNAEANMTFDGSTLDVTGAIRATGDITAFYSSDKNLKENISNIENSLDKVSKLNGVYYNWTKEAQEKHSHFGKEKEVGVIAQDVEAVLPEIVATREDGTKAVRYERLCAVLIESVKELKKEIEELKKGA